MSLFAAHAAGIAAINAAFTPTAAQIEQARAIVAAFHQAPNAGVLMLEGKMIDAPNFLQARKILARAGVDK